MILTLVVVLVAALVAALAAALDLKIFLIRSLAEGVELELPAKVRCKVMTDLCQ